VGHSVDLSELQQIVGKYVTQYNLLVAAGPIAAAGIFRLVLGKSKMMNLAMAGAGAWFAVKELSGPMLGLITDQFGYLQSLLGR
jgi:hypothetical protein